MRNLNSVYSSLSSRRRYEVWFLRMGLAGEPGAWWFRYLLLNPGRARPADDSLNMPVQVWATWFRKDAAPGSAIQGFGLDQLRLSSGADSFQFRVENNSIGDNSCCGDLSVFGHRVTWNLTYKSTFATTLSNKGWIGFSRTPHSDATFSGYITFDERRFEGDPLGYGLQGHNCGYRHRNFWTWAHLYFAGEQASTLEALIYDLPFGLTFRRAILWHRGRKYDFRIVKEHEDRDQLQWNFQGVSRDGSKIEVSVDGRGISTRRLPYFKTDGSGSFEVANNSMANASLRFQAGARTEELQTTGGAVLEMGGER
ncbi:MAG TPA: hypothetical protein VFA68_19445 [Terriglobales bacterium]|nr:hypothetical protein [Terriglobales bacterium]